MKKFIFCTIAGLGSLMLAEGLRDCFELGNAKPERAVERININEPKISNLEQGLRRGLKKGDMVFFETDNKIHGAIYQGRNDRGDDIFYWKGEQRTCKQITNECYQPTKFMRSSE